MIAELEAMTLMLARWIEKVKELEADRDKWKNQAEAAAERLQSTSVTLNRWIAETGGVPADGDPLTHAVKAAVAVTAPDHLAAKFLRSCGWMNNGQVWTKPTHQQYVAVGMAAKSELERALQAFKGILG